MQLNCTVPQCSTKSLPERMALPEMAALRRANGGRTPTAEELAKFVLCWRHSRLLRDEGVRVYRFGEVKNLLEKRAAERLTFRPFADRFLPKAKAAGQEPKARAK